MQVWNPAARQVSAAQGKTLSQNARIFALLAMAMADASIATFDSKYHYNFWRPVTAIQNGDVDGNAATQRDASWFPLITTPAFPGYPSAHATLSSAARAVLERAYGKHGHNITLINATLAIELHYTAFDQMTNDIDDARVYGGIHFRFDQEAGGHQDATSVSTSFTTTCAREMKTTTLATTSEVPGCEGTEYSAIQRGHSS